MRGISKAERREKAMTALDMVGLRALADRGRALSRAASSSGSRSPGSS